MEAPFGSPLPPCGAKNAGIPGYSYAFDRFTYIYPSKPSDLYAVRPAPERAGPDSVPTLPGPVAY